MSLRRALALGGFALRVNLGTRATWIGALAGLAVLLLGPTLALHAGRGWSFDPELGLFGFLLAALFLLRSGLETQRAVDLDTFLRHGLATPLEHAAGMVVSLLGSWAILCAAGFLAILAVSGGDAGLAAWHAGAWGTRAFLLLGFVPWVEARAELRVPFLLPALAYLGLVVALTVVLDEERAIALFTPVDREAPATLARLASHAALAFAAAGGGFVLASARRPGLLWRRLRRAEVVSLRHGRAPEQG
jgi:hypothetical protein